MPLHIHDPKCLRKDLIIFYCWQDHLDRKLHRFLIRDALNGAIKRVQEEMPDTVDCVLRQDSDTAGRAGSVEIADTILQKINASSIIVADVTPVMFDEARKTGCPNPNVMMELGYGARAIGWNRVISVFNDTGHKDRLTPENLPFDIRHRRLTSYSCAGDSQKAQASNELEGKLVVSIRAVLQEIGRGVFDPSLGDTALKRGRDVKLLRQLLETIHRNTMDKIIERGTASNVHYDGLLFWEGFNAVMNSSHFRFYDKTLEELAWKLHNLWKTAVHIGSTVLYPGNAMGAFCLLPQHQWTNNYERLVKEMGEAYASMPGTLKAFLDHVHANYPEIDLNLTDKAAWEENVPYMVANQSLPKPKKITATAIFTAATAVKPSQKKSAAP